MSSSTIVDTPNKNSTESIKDADASAIQIASMDVNAQVDEQLYDERKDG